MISLVIALVLIARASTCKKYKLRGNKDLAILRRFMNQGENSVKTIFVLASATQLKRPQLLRHRGDRNHPSPLAVHFHCTEGTRSFMRSAFTHFQERASSCTSSVEQENQNSASMRAKTK